MGVKFLTNYSYPLFHAFMTFPQLSINLMKLNKILISINLAQFLLAFVKDRFLLTKKNFNKRGNRNDEKNSR
jgi:hypothetical protein